MHFKLVHFSAMILALGWAFAAIVQGQQPDERSAIAHLRSIGVELEYDNGHVVGVDFLRSSSSDSDAAYLASLKSLRSINFGQRKFSDNALKHLVGLENLRSVNLSLCPVTDRGLETLTGNRNIEHLDLTGTDITDLKPLGQFEKLKTLELAHCLVTDAQLVHLSQIGSLVELDLGSTEVTDVGVGHIAELDNLETLCLANDRITDSGASKLVNCSNLKWLQLAYSIGNGWQPSHCHVSADVLRELKENLPGLNIHGRPAQPITGRIGLLKNSDLIVVQITISDLIGLADKSVVQSIDFTDSIVDDESLASLDQFTSLRSLRLGGTWITDATLKKIANLRPLETLDLRDTRVTDVGVAHLSTCTELKTLNLHNTMLSGSAFEEMTALRNLVDLDVSQNRGDTRWYGRSGLSSGITDQGLQFISQLDWIERLNLECYDFSSGVSADGIRRLFNLTHLRELGVYGLPINDELLKELKLNLPNAKLDYKTTYGFLD